MTRRPIDRREFAAVWALGVLGVAASIPYLLGTGILDPDALPESLSLPAAIAASLAQTSVLLAAATAVGLALGPPVGLRTPFLDALTGDDPMPDLRPVVAQAVGFGLAAGACVVAADALVFAPRVDLDVAAGTGSSAALTGVLAAFAGGTYEEILLRFGLMTLVVWLLWRARPGPDGMPRPWMHWAGILAAALLFGAGHLPATAQIAGLTPLVVARALVLNGLPGVVFGWLYWKGGLEAAMLAHAAAGLVLHVVAPLAL